MEKMTFSQKLENIWYHYKYGIIFGGISIFFLIILISQMLFKGTPDANFLYIGTADISFTSTGELQKSAAKFIKEDYNGDGEITIDYLELTVLDPQKAQDFDKTTYTQKEIDTEAGKRFTAELIGGDTMIYFADKKYYDIARNQEVLMPLAEALGYTPEKALDEYSIYLRDLDIFYLDGFKKLPADTIVFIRYPVSVTQSKDKIEEREKNNISVFQDMFAYSHPDKPEDKINTATRVDENEFLTLYKNWCNENQIEITEPLVITELSGDEVFEKTGATVYKCDYRTFLIFDGVLRSIGRSDGGDGVCDMELCDFDNDGISDLFFTFTYREGNAWSASAAVFNTTNTRVINMSLGTEFVDGAKYVIEKISESSFEILETAPSDEDLSAALTSLVGDKKVCEFYAVDGNIIKK